MMIVISPPARRGIAVKRAVTETEIRMLRNADRYNLVCSVRARPDALRALEINPRAAALLFAFRGPLRKAKRKEFTLFGRALIGIGNDERLALPFKPQFAEQPRRVQIVPDFVHSFTGKRVRVIRNLRNVPALLAIFVEHLDQRTNAFPEGHAIRGIKDQKIHARAGQELHMAAQHPFVAHSIKAEKRLIPIQRALIPSGVSRIVKSLGALAHQSRDVHGILFLLPARTMGQEIKAADDAVFPRFAHLIRIRKQTIQRIERI